MPVDHELAVRVQAAVLDGFGAVTAGLDVPEADPETLAAGVVAGGLQFVAETVVRETMGRDDPHLAMKMVAACRTAMRDTWTAEQRYTT